MKPQSLSYPSPCIPPPPAHPSPFTSMAGGRGLLEKDTTPASRFPGLSPSQRPLQPAQSPETRSQPGDLPQLQCFRLLCCPSLQGPWGPQGHWVILHLSPCSLSLLHYWGRGPAWPWAVHQRPGHCQQCPVTAEKLDLPTKPRPMYSPEVAPTHTVQGEAPGRGLVPAEPHLPHSLPRWGR